MSQKGQQKRIDNLYLHTKKCSIQLNNIYSELIKLNKKLDKTNNTIEKINIVMIIYAVVLTALIIIF
jgi:hypothetical protein